MIRSWLIRLVLVFGIFTAVWLTTLFYWHTTNRIPTTSEIVVYLLLFPVAILAGIWTIKKIRDTKHAGLANPISEQAELQANTTNSEAVSAAQLPIVVLASAMRTLHGNSAQEFMDAVKMGKANLDLDPHLQNMSGFPILSGRVADLNEDEQAETLAQWCTSLNMDSIEWSGKQLRALWLGHQSLLDLMQHAMQHDVFSSHIAGITQSRSNMVLPVLRLLLLFPDDWKAEQIQYATEWFVHLMVEQGWPQERIVVHPRVKDSNTTVAAEIDTLLHSVNQVQTPCTSIVLSCSSFIDEALVERWENDGLISDEQGRPAQVPGEAAAGLLLADQTQATFFNADSTVLLHKSSHAIRSKSVDDPGRVNADKFIEVSDNALKTAMTDSTQVQMVIGDTSHRVSRVSELASMCFHLFADLEFNSQVLKIANHCGHLGETADVLALVLAHHQVTLNKEPVLCSTNRDQYLRTAVVLSSFPEEAALEA